MIHNNNYSFENIACNFLEDLSDNEINYGKNKIIKKNQITEKTK